MQDITNQHTDGYRGSIENCAQFALKVADAVVEAVGAERMSFQISPWGTFNGMGMADPKPQFSYLVEQLHKHKLAYIHVTEPMPHEITAKINSDFIRDIWWGVEGSTFISTNRHTWNSAIETADKKGGLIGFGRLFMPNPDLPFRLLKDLALEWGDQAMWYMAGNSTPAAFLSYGMIEAVCCASRRPSRDAQLWAENNVDCGNRQLSTTAQHGTSEAHADGPAPYTLRVTVQCHTPHLGFANEPVFKHTRATDTVVCNTGFYTELLVLCNLKPANYVYLSGYYLLVNIACGAMILVGLKSHEGGSTIGDRFTVLIKFHVLYFARLLMSLQRFGIQILLELRYSGALEISSCVQMFVLGPRLILSVREYHAKLADQL
ncbi:hypothetical protein BDR07DRAFT_1377868 [Suillus spraguei]|nr:hypothetical protein BDR07DRAFT_1377868 [Suillus spraguei]